MKKVIYVGALASILSGCAAELLVLPIAIAAAPIVLPLDAVQTNSTITQPVTVVSASGQVLVAPPEASIASKASFKTTRATLRCTGKSKSGPTQAKPAKLKISCSNGMRGDVKVDSNLTVGYRFIMKVEGAGAKGLSCLGNYRAAGKTAGPFLVNCEHTREEYVDFNKIKKAHTTVATRQAAVSAGATASGAFSVTLWVPGI
ncbi:MAG: hypothetical protein ABJL99_09010 [Aliishimia sp.]